MIRFIVNNACCTTSFKWLLFIHKYLSTRQQRNKVHYSFSTYCGIIYRVPLSCILGPLLFQCVILKHVFEEQYWQLYRWFHTLQKQHSAGNSIPWFRENFMEPNPDKGHLSIRTDSTLNVAIENFDIKIVQSQNHNK